MGFDIIEINLVLIKYHMNYQINYKIKYQMNFQIRVSFANRSFKDVLLLLLSFVVVFKVAVWIVDFVVVVFVVVIPNNGSSDTSEVSHRILLLGSLL